MNHADPPYSPAQRKRLFEAFYALSARDIMARDVGPGSVLPAHYPVLKALEILLTRDHLWVRGEDPGRDEISSVLVRRDLLRALEPTHASYSRFSKVRFRSLAHGSADCICCFTEGRVLHRLTPATPCKEILHLMEAKGALYLPVLEGDSLVGEIGSLDMIRAFHSLQKELGEEP